MSRKQSALATVACFWIGFAFVFLAFVIKG